MTAVRKSTMKRRSRYRAIHPKKKKRSALFFVNVVFLICFTFYQILLSKSNGGRDAVASTYRSFLKKGGNSNVFNRNAVTDGEADSIERDHAAHSEMMEGEGEHERLNESNLDPKQSSREQKLSSEGNKIEFEDYADAIPRSVLEHNPFSEENEVKDEMEGPDIPHAFRDHNPFSPENEVQHLRAESDGIPSESHDNNPFAEESGVDLSEGMSRIDSTQRQPYIFDPDHQMFHNYFKGKSGKVVEEMLMAHAYIFHQNATYGGCCGSKSAKVLAHEELLDSLGLNGPLRFRCPRDYVQDTMTRRSVIPRDRFMADDTRVWTPEYVEYLRSLVTYPEKRHKEYTIVVHMLRGNTSPCKEKSRGYHSYLPNIHYQNLIDKYMKPGARVIIYTSSKSFEDLNEFRERGYEVNTESSLKDSWKDFVTADVFIMSRSDFSMVPAMVAKGMVVYTPFWHRSLRRWQRVSKKIMKQTEDETSLLQETKCLFPIG